MRRSRRPSCSTAALWERSGHWDHYKENMYTTKIDDMDFAIKPMNCPGGILVYKRKPWTLSRPAHARAASWVWCTVTSCPARCTV